VEVIPRYGFEPSEEGVEMMLRSFTLFHGDPDIYINEVAIKEALSLEVKASKAVCCSDLVLHVELYSTPACRLFPSAS
ncbi:unnamed protein product, partial [Symbiodinium sp. CCMP2456]